MLRLKEDRINYGEALLPPVKDGKVFKLVHAVGTTYSLDMQTLMAVCVPLGLREATDSDLAKNPMALLKALQEITDKLVIFCDAGHIAEDHSSSKLMLLLDKVICEVKLPKRNRSQGFPSFHPKTWFLKYADEEGNEIYRVIILSRNLTTSRSWDVAVPLEGIRGDNINPKAEPLGSFMAFLNAQIQSNDSDKNRKRRITRAFMEELPYLDFPELKNDKVFTDYQFMPLGIKDGAYDISKDQIFNNSYTDLFVMSPFVTAETVLTCNQYPLKGARHHLFTNTSQLHKFKGKDLGNLEILRLRDSISEGEFTISDDERDAPKVEDIHAKVVLFRRYSETYLYLGSMNYSHSGTERNVEMMLRLCGRNRYVNLDTVEHDLLGDDINTSPFTKVTPEEIDMKEEPNDPKDNLEHILRTLCRTKGMEGRVSTPDSEGKYDVTVHIPAKEIYANVSFQPIRVNDKWVMLDEKMEFKGLELMQLSELYKVRIADDDGNEIVRMVKVPTEIPDERDRQIVKSVISDKKAFIYYLSFILGDDAVLAITENGALNDSGNAEQVIKEVFPAIYEKMLQTAYSAPERLKDINKIYEAVKDDGVVPEDFADMYKTFLKTLRIKC